MCSYPFVMFRFSLEFCVNSLISRWSCILSAPVVQCLNIVLKCRGFIPLFYVSLFCIWIWTMFLHLVDLSFWGNFYLFLFLGLLYWPLYFFLLEVSVCCCHFHATLLSWFPPFWVLLSRYKLPQYCCTFLGIQLASLSYCTFFVLL